MGKLIDLTGKKFERLTVLSRAGTDTTPAGTVIPTWHCRCDCGTEVVVRGNSLRTGNTRSCGCFRKEYERGRWYPVLKALRLTDEIITADTTRITVVGQTV